MPVCHPLIYHGVMLAEGRVQLFNNNFGVGFCLL